ncbi:alpha/beta hydrolase [Oceanospirillum sediminis]|uniref:Alpha/beta hydrolase n=1 Tax=Oceanospirillum sediminis TaxID=2760088 RepID=A0A839IKR5_9GAMM|nr:alpha/beta hydrolase [Oceanospirillum sediminis]MBB1485300.1 alpha/beta hydrolase [Oceanospirillum sediminis]
MSVVSVHPNLEGWRVKFHQMLAELEVAGIQPTPETARQALAGLTQRYVTSGPEVLVVKDLEITTASHSIPLRYYCDSESGEGKPLNQLILFIHGGGHMAGSVEVYDPICRRLARHSYQPVLSIEYRLAPEHPWPAGIDDVRSVLDALPGLADELDFDPNTLKLSLVGDSGGGAMAATICLQPAPGVIRPKKLVLIYPSLDYRMITPSVREFADGYMLTAERMRWYFDHYLQDRAEPLSISPLEMPLPESFPDTLVINAGFDPLRDEAALFHEKVSQSGFNSELLTYPGMLHAFLNLESMVPEVCDDAYKAMAGFLQDRSVVG